MTTNNNANNGNPNTSTIDANDGQTFPQTETVAVTVETAPKKMGLFGKMLVVGGAGALAGGAFFLGKSLGTTTVVAPVVTEAAAAAFRALRG